MISVIVPTYNCDKYICEALDSALQQTYTNIEIIVIDDGSTDTTGSLIKTSYQTVRYYCVENRGVAAARNFGISQAHGEFIAFLDADDRWLPEKLAKQVELFEADASLGLVFTENVFFDDQGIRALSQNKRHRLMHGNIVRNIFLRSYVVTSTVMVRKSVLDDVGVFDEELSVAEDDNLWMRVGMKYGIALVDEALVWYRKTQGSLSSNFPAVVCGVNKQIELLKSRYLDLYDRIGPFAIRRKYAELYFSEAYKHFSRGNYALSRSRFIDSYISNPFMLKSLMYYFSTCLPEQIIKMIRVVKRTVSKIQA